MKTILLLLFLLPITINVFAQQLDSLLYTEDRKLNWNDFRVNPTPADSANGAEIAVTIVMKVRKVSIWTSRATFDAYAVQYKNNSWVLPEYMNDYTLWHEQIHFDIAYLYAKKLEAEINSLSISIHQQDIIGNIYKKWVNLMSLYQDLYDLQTQGGNDTAKQKEWNTKISEALKAFDNNSF